MHGASRAGASDPGLGTERFSAPLQSCKQEVTDVRGSLATPETALLSRPRTHQALTFGSSPWGTLGYLLPGQLSAPASPVAVGCCCCCRCCWLSVSVGCIASLQDGWEEETANGLSGAHLGTWGRHRLQGWALERGCGPSQSLTFPLHLGLGKFRWCLPWAAGLCLREV